MRHNADDEQLGCYYVAQVTEVIDHSVHSQKEIFKRFASWDKKYSAGGCLMEDFQTACRKSHPFGLFLEI